MQSQVHDQQVDGSSKTLCSYLWVNDSETLPSLFLQMVAVGVVDWTKRPEDRRVSGQATHANAHQVQATGYIRHGKLALLSQTQSDIKPFETNRA